MLNFLTYYLLYGSLFVLSFLWIIQSYPLEFTEFWSDPETTSSTQKNSPPPSENNMAFSIMLIILVWPILLIMALVKLWKAKDEG